jgi:hypothetical protein
MVLGVVRDRIDRAQLAQINDGRAGFIVETVVMTVMVDAHDREHETRECQC